jgi:phage tail-like protein
MAETRNPEYFYQTVNFLFRVEFHLGSDAFDISFQSVSGLDSSLETETIKEGGENRFEHVIPVRRKYGPLILKRGLFSPEESKLTEWLKRAFDDEIVEPLETLNITLLNEGKPNQNREPLMYWTINNVWPRSWKMGELNAERGEVLIETLELNYNRLVFKA